MDADKQDQREEDEQIQYKSPTVPFLRPAQEGRSPSISSLDSQDSDIGTNADVDLLSPDMDGTGDGYRRRRAQLMDGYRNGSAKGKRYGRRNSRRRRRDASGNPDEEHKHKAYASDDGPDSEFSSTSNSDDVELSRLASEDALSEDEETGLTRKDRSHRKRRRRKTTRLDERIAGDIKNSKQEQKAADRNVLKALIINALLILSWYLFSLSISIVGIAVLVYIACSLTHTAV